MFATIRPHIEGRVSEKVNGLLADTPSAWEQAAEEYRPMTHAIAKSLSPGFTTMAVQWRRQIGGTLPNMRTRAQEGKKPKHRKEGDK